MLHYYYICLLYIGVSWSHQSLIRSSRQNTLLRQPFKRQLDETPSNVQYYALWSPEEIGNRARRWAEHYTDLITVTTAQEKYGLPAAGTESDCPFEADQPGCRNYILTIQDYTTHPEGSDSSARLPEVFWSGEVHGDEQVGPTTVLETAQLLMDATMCVAHPRLAIQQTGDAQQWKNEMEIARSCRRDFSARGIDEDHLKWMARLVATRRIVIVPTANALGYYRKEREEDGIDPNRDFPFDLKGSRKCMQSIAARTLNEVFQQHLFQLSLTFHGGMEAIGYEWGAPSYSDPYISPDDLAQKDIASAYSRYGGGWKTSQPYSYGPMNQDVYPVRGGFEDWAYAGSWDTAHVEPCQPNTFGGYNTTKTTYDNATLRVFNMLVETSRVKIPSDLGTSWDLMSNQQKDNGHVARNIRLALLSAELVEPYVSLTAVNELLLSDDIVPLVAPNERSCPAQQRVAVPSNAKTATIKWKVGGALTVDNTQVWYAAWNEIPSGLLDCVNQPDSSEVEQYMNGGVPLSTMSGTTLFSSAGATLFSASIDLSAYKPHDKLAIVVSAKVDQSWARTPTSYSPVGVPPQSHMANVRTNESWYFEKDEKIIQGRLYWFSSPLTIEIGDYEDNIGRQGDRIVDTVELSNRFGEPTGQGFQGGVRPSNSGSTGSSNVSSRFASVLFVLVLGAVILFTARAYLRYQMRQSRRLQVREFIEDESAPSPGLRHKSPRSYQDDVNGDLELGEYT